MKSMSLALDKAAIEGARARLGAGAVGEGHVQLLSRAPCARIAPPRPESPRGRP